MTSTFNDKKVVMVAVAVLLLSLQLSFAQNFAQPRVKHSIAVAPAKLEIGETLEYNTEWLGLPVGKAVLKVIGIEKVNGHDCYHIVAEAVPNDFLKRFINLQYKVDTFIDVRLLCSRRFEKLRRMNEATNHVVIELDQEAGKVKYASEGGAEAIVLSQDMRSLYEKVPVTYDIPYKTQDLVSAFYQFRLLTIKEKTDYAVNIYYSERNWKTSFKVGEPYRQDFRKLGTMPVFTVKISSELNDFIIGKRGFTVYFSNDARRVPIEFVFNTAVGPIRCLLRSQGD
jgi:hypothetical protein